MTEEPGEERPQTFATGATLIYVNEAAVGHLVEEGEIIIPGADGHRFIIKEMIFSDPETEVDEPVDGPAEPGIGWQ